MGFRYAVLGAGRQGVSAAFDLARFGEAEEVRLVDVDLEAARTGAGRVDDLLSRRVATAAQADVRDADRLASVLEGVTSLISAVPYPLNPAVTEVALRVGANMCDLGGSTELARRQLERDAAARRAGVTLVPDCGFGPGMNLGLAAWSISLLDVPREVYIWEGGLPQDPQPPWNYLLTFNIAGLTHEYDGYSYFLREGRVVEVPCFAEREELDFPEPLGRLEAFVTAGGLSTAPWTFEERLERLENKTLRYPGHWAQFVAFAQLGLLSQAPLRVGEVEIAPRLIFEALLQPQITRPQIRDVCVLRVRCVGEKDGRPAEAVCELIDYYDEATGFTAMERTTGWHASMVAIQAARGQIRRGAVPVELALSGPTFMAEAKRRGFKIEERVTILE